MTANEWADVLKDETIALHGRMCWMGTAFIADVIRRAVTEEREACALIALAVTADESGCCAETSEQIAAVIRSRP